MKWIVATAPLLLGLCICAAGFMYDLLYAGIPYQDPPPALQADYNVHASIAAAIETIGLLVMAVGAVWLIGNGAYHLIRRSKR
jgi:hypothetical protein